MGHLGDRQNIKYGNNSSGIHVAARGVIGDLIKVVSTPRYQVYHSDAPRGIECYNPPDRPVHTLWDPEEATEYFPNTISRKLE